ncbi:MAG: hypothetical protein SPI65_07325 [Peptoniphilus sp.]|nr:hypothetical protein [Peptoniphilus sp.]MDD7363273.1 hypothetical protein [Bacillota bacterium]MDY6045366.1 hypothetical protein [Peptoniphilus sp.]
MDTMITLHDLLRFLLYVAGIGALVFLMIALKNIAGILKVVKNKLETHDAVIDDTFQKLPTITDNATIVTANASRITTDATEMIEIVKPEVEKVASTVGDVTETVDSVVRKVDQTSSKIQNTADVVSDSISDTAKTISFNANNVVDYFYILREVLESLRDVIRTK